MNERASMQAQKTTEAPPVHTSVKGLQHTAVNDVSLDAASSVVHDTLQSSMPSLAKDNSIGGLHATPTI